jgi:tetratricopeptide (TPR) repeat protein
VRAHRHDAGRLALDTAVVGHFQQQGRDRPLQFDLANPQLAQGREADAGATLRKLCEQPKATGGPLNNLAWLLTNKGGKVDEALSLINRAIEIDGETPEPLDTRGTIYLAMGRNDAAIRDLEDALAARPLPEIYFHLARAYLVAGRRNDAGEAIRKAESGGPRVEGLHPAEPSAFNRLLGELTQR